MLPTAGDGFLVIAAMSLPEIGSLLVGLAVAAVILFFWWVEVFRGVLWLWRLPFRTPLVGVLLIALLGLYYNADLVYGDAADRMKEILGGYFLGLSLAFALSLAHDPFAGMSLGRFLSVASLAFLAGAAIFAFINPLNPDAAAFTSENVAILATHALVVAVIEELIFRFVLPFIFQVFGPWAAQAISALAFAFMHLSVYTTALANPSLQGIAGPLLFVGLLGLAFGAFVIFWAENGLVAGMGFHFAWNAYTLGFIGATPAQTAVGLVLNFIGVS